MPNDRANSLARRIATHRSGFAAVSALVAAVAAGTGLAQNGVPDTDALVSAVLAPEDDAQARSAAVRLLELGQYAQLNKIIETAPNEASRVAVVAVVAMTPAGERSDEQIRLLGAALPRVRGAALEVAMLALGEHRTRLAVRPVITLLMERPGDEARALALQTLVRQTGMDTLGADIEAWSAWWAEVEWLTEPEWRSRLATAHAARAARLDNDRAALVDRLSDVYRRLHAATAQEHRSALLAEMLVDTRAELRLVAMELAQRTVLNARPLGDPAIAALLERLRDPDPRVRQLAASVVGRAAPANAPAAVGAALRVERDPEVAATLLTLAARWPTKVAIEAALEWMTGSPAHRAAAGDALASAARAGLLDDPALRNRVLDAMRLALAEAITPSMVRLAEAVGEEQDIAGLTPLLLDQRPELRQAAVAALVRRPGREHLLERALAGDPELLQLISQGLAARSPTFGSLQWVRSAAERAGVTVTALHAAEDAFLPLMPPSDALRAAESIADPLRRAAALDRLAERPALHSSAEQGVRTRALLAAAETRLGVPDPAGAIETVQRLAGADEGGALRIRTIALLLQDQIEAAERLGAPAGVWVEALERCVGAGVPHAQRVEQALLRLFSATLTSQELARVDAARQRGFARPSTTGEDL